MADIVNKLWGFCHTLRHDGVDYGDYIEQLTYLLFLKMADEKEIDVDKKYNWNSLKDLSGTELTDHYAETLRKLREGKGILGKIFTQAMPRITNPVNLKRLINMIDEEDWSSMDVDVKGEAFEGLLEKSANEGKKGAGQYFTPRELIRSMIRVMKPDPRTRKDLPAGQAGLGGWGRAKRKGPRTKAPFTSHHPLPPKRSFNKKLTDSGQLAAEIGQLDPVNAAS